MIFSQYDGQRCVLDGQQRLTTIYRYKKGKFHVDDNYYNDLSEDEQEDFKNYNIAVQEFVLEDEDDDCDVINTFSILNAGQQVPRAMRSGLASMVPTFWGHPCKASRLKKLMKK
ncbi:unnamed protein product [marine sediment metagenome]|uniref:DUF262 domain-containing protein n=1 Tax=marine sediment metagenome TaxID=412755 RepID=X0UZ93_9ZZZZ